MSRLRIVTPTAVVVLGVLSLACASPTPRRPSPAPSPAPSLQGAIRVDGSPAALPLLAALARAYEAAVPDARVTIGTGLGSSARVAALVENRIDVAVTGQPVTADVMSQHRLRAHEIALAAVVFAVPSEIAIAGLTSVQLCDAFAGRVTDWRAFGGPSIRIAPRTRPRGEVDADVAIAGVPCLRDAIAAGSVLVIERPEAMVAALVTTAGAIGMTSMPFIQRSGGRLRALALDGIAPAAAQVRGGAYPLTRRSVLLTRAALPAHVARFLTFIRGAEGARVIAASGAVTPP